VCVCVYACVCVGILEGVLIFALQMGPNVYSHTHTHIPFSIRASSAQPGTFTLGDRVRVVDEEGLCVCMYVCKSVCVCIYKSMKEGKEKGE
jgi:hypothetical protein